MNIAKLSLRQWLTLYEVSHYLTSKLNCGSYGSENGINEPDVLNLALAGRFPLTLDFPPGMEDKQGVELENGYWDLPITKERGKPGKLQVKHQLNQSVSVRGIDGAWVWRKSAGKRVVRQLRPRAGLEGFHSAFPEGCALGVRTKALNDFAKKQGHTPPKSADALDKPLGEKERTTLLVIIAALANKARIDVLHPTTAAKNIMPFVELLGTKLSRQAIERKLKLVPDAVEKHKTLKQ